MSEQHKQDSDQDTKKFIKEAIGNKIVIGFSLNKDDLKSIKIKEENRHHLIERVGVE